MVGREYGGPPPQPKPYGFVSVTRERVPRQRPAGHDDFEADLVSGTIVGVITALTPVHVASGQIELTGKPEPPLVKAHVRVGDRPVIPGSSLKGSIRSIVEAISASCIRITRARRDQQPKEAVACQKLDQLCVACRMFGALGYQGQVRFSDAVLRGNRTEIIQVPPLYTPRPQARLYYEGGQIKGRKFYRHGKLAQGNVPIEVCPAGSRFDFSVQFDNLTPAELGLLLIALGQGESRLHPKLGGGKPACCGTVEIAVTELKVVDMTTAYFQYDADMKDADVNTYLEAAKELVLPDQLRELAELLRYPSERECPNRNY
jgi:CRISPR/Cas system CSM-associated protein Csm3 (group 7 of RAMP superfamily)